MRRFSNDPNVIIAEALTPNVDGVAELFRRGGLRLKARLSPARDPRPAAERRWFFAFLPAPTLTQADIRALSRRAA